MFIRLASEFRGRKRNNKKNRTQHAIKRHGVKAPRSSQEHDRYSGKGAK